MSIDTLIVSQKPAAGKWATCFDCRQEMAPGHGCRLTTTIIGGKSYARIRFAPWETTSVCHDCNAMPGQLHHPGCDGETCPACGGQQISCECVPSWAESEGR